MTLTFNNIMIFFFGFHVSELKYAQEREAEDNNKRKHISKNKKRDVHKIKWVIPAFAVGK